MMLDPLQHRPLRQQVFEVASPARRVLSLPEPARHRPIDDRLYPAPYPARRFGLIRPYRLDYLHDRRGVDRLNRELAEDGVSVILKGRRPLRGMLGIPPASLVRPDIGLRAFLERDRTDRLKLRFSPLKMSRLDRIDPLKAQPAAFERLLPCIGKPHGMKGPEPHLARAAVQR